MCAAPHGQREKIMGITAPRRSMHERLEVKGTAPGRSPERTRRRECPKNAE